MTWNVEGLKNHSHSLCHFIDQISPSLVFISEPQIFQCDIPLIMMHSVPHYHYNLNSENLYETSLPLDKCKAKGGTLLLWPPSLDPHITILPTNTPALLPCMLKLPGLVTSYHIGIYFPTAGRDDQFISTLASLNILLEDIFEKHDAECPVFIRGDANASSKNVARSQMLTHFLAQHNLLRLNITHKTYHHFVGNGAFDSDLDVVLFSNMLHFFLFFFI